MGKNKNALIRYTILDRCLSNPYRKYFIEDLVDEVNNELIQDHFVSGVSKRQVYEDLRFMESSQGWNIELEHPARENRKRYYRYSDKEYSIRNSPLGERQKQIIDEALLLLSNFHGLPGFYWLNEAKVKLTCIRDNLDDEIEHFVSFAQNPYLEGLNHFAEIYDAIKNKRVLSIKYKPFTHKSSNKLEIHPYYLKQYNERWFLFGHNKQVESISNLALDRIKSLNTSNNKYIPNAFVDFRDFFEDVVGVTVNNEDNAHRVLLSVKNETMNYIRTKPIHGSQKIIKKGKKNTQIQLQLKINYELKSQLLSYGSGLKVLEPKHLAMDIQKWADELLAIYKE
ncbi:MAG: WYL domain-containing protein [Cryomorphaceae bacterium]|nr:WYL domain-containing protein [Cryomorphaceae bacterium]